MITYLLLCSLLVAATVYAIVAKNSIRAAAAAGVGSLALAMMFFHQGAPYAGGFELGVEAGLMSVLFIVAIGYTKLGGDRDDA
jgi:NADH:ubiquinone oxidoreductase subunit 6 (subunit J)